MGVQVLQAPLLELLLDTLVACCALEDGQEARSPPSCPSNTDHKDLIPSRMRRHMRKRTATAPGTGHDPARAVPDGSSHRGMGLQHLPAPRRADTNCACSSTTATNEHSMSHAAPADSPASGASAPAPPTPELLPLAMPLSVLADMSAGSSLQDDLEAVEGGPSNLSAALAAAAASAVGLDSQDVSGSCGSGSPRQGFAMADGGGIADSSAEDEQSSSPVASAADLLDGEEEGVVSEGEAQPAEAGPSGRAAAEETLALALCWLHSLDEGARFGLLGSDTPALPWPYPGACVQQLAALLKGMAISRIRLSFGKSSYLGLHC